MGKIIAELSPGQSAGHDPWAWGSKCRPRRAGITGREVPWEPKNGRETRGNTKNDHFRASKFGCKVVSKTGIN